MKHSSSNSGQRYVGEGPAGRRKRTLKSSCLLSTSSIVPNHHWSSYTAAIYCPMAKKEITSALSSAFNTENWSNDSEFEYLLAWTLFPSSTTLFISAAYQHLTNKCTHMHMCRKIENMLQPRYFLLASELFLINSVCIPINGPLRCGLTVWTSCLCTVYLVYAEHRLGLTTTLGFLRPNRTHRAKQTLSLVNDTFADVANIHFTSPHKWIFFT